MGHQRVINNRWFSFADLAFVSVSVVIWEIQPRLAWWALLIALIPWLLRLLSGCFPFQRTGFDLPMAVFLLTAVVGVWAAYDRDGALGKFWLLIGGILLYYALAGQPRENLWAIAGFLSLVGVGVAAFFLFTNDWEQYPAKIGLLNQAGLGWMKVRPLFQVEGVHPNRAGAVMAITAPFLVALGIKAWNEKRILLGVWVLAGGGLISTGFMLATSRGAALALVGGLGIWLLWALSNQMARFGPLKPRTMFGLGLITVIVLGVAVAFAYPGGPIGLANSMPGPPSASSRLELTESALKLVGDFPITGGGLNSFSGLYSRYIREIPFFISLNSHNMYLDVGVEQGILGALAFSFIYLGSLFRIAAYAWKTPKGTLLWASFASMLIVVLQGLTDDLVFGPWGAPLVFLVPGISYAMARSSPCFGTLRPSMGLKIRGSIRGSRRRQLMFGTGVLACIALLMVVYVYRQRLVAVWYADLGAVLMARTQLTGFPAGVWDEDYDLAELEPAERLFEGALRRDAWNRTAHHRLGLMAWGRGDYPEAVSHLERAYQVDPNHRGIRKVLGYNYVWTEQIDQASALLAEIPEAASEMAVYAWWWGTHGRDDLAERAAKMAERLQAFDNQP